MYLTMTGRELPWRHFLSSKIASVIISLYGGWEVVFFFGGVFFGDFFFFGGVFLGDFFFSGEREELEADEVFLGEGAWCL